MKDLGKTSSTDSTESISFHTEKSSDSTSGVDVNDDVCQLTDEIVDKHLAELKRKCMSYDTRDVAKFMEKLKTQSESFDGEGDEKKAPDDGEKRVRKESESRKELEKVPKVKDSKVDADKEQKKDTIHVKLQRKPSLSPQGSVRKPKTIDMDTYASSSSGDNQVHIVKIKSSPSGSRKASRENSRSNSTERSPSREKQALKKPEGGILKKPSPKFGKASELRMSNSLRPDSFISPFSSFESKSDKLSPSSETFPSTCAKEKHQRASLSDYERDPIDYHHQAMKSRSLESSLEHLKSALKPQSSYENYSPVHPYDPSRYYGLSAQHSIESNRSPVRYCSPNPPHHYNEPFYEYPKHQHKRESRSLERPDYSRQSSSEYERYYEEPPLANNRRHSVYEHRSIPHHYYSMSPDDYLMSHYEQPSACVDCYHQSYHQPHLHYSQQQPPPLPQRNTQPQQKSPSTTIKRQSRSRKKLSRRMSSNYFNKSFDDDDMQHAPVGKQSNDNDEIHV